MRPMNHHTRLLGIVAITSGMVVTVVRQVVFPDARWWNLVMAGLLLVVLAGYLWQERQRRN